MDAIRAAESLNCQLKSRLELCETQLAASRAQLETLGPLCSELQANVADALQHFQELKDSIDTETESVEAYQRQMAKEEVTLHRERVQSANKSYLKPSRRNGRAGFKGRCEVSSFSVEVGYAPI